MKAARLRNLLFSGLAIATAVIVAPPSYAEGETRVLVVRERAEASLLEGGFTFRLLKIRGYSIDIAVDGARRVLKLGEGFSPAGAACSIVFEEISPETRLARFATDCS